MNIAAELLGCLQVRSGDAAIFSTVDGGEMSSREFMHRVEHRSAVLADSIAPGEMVLVASGRGSDFFVDLLALWRIGAVAVPYSPGDGDGHLALLQEISGARVRLDACIVHSGGDLPPASSVPGFAPREEEEPCAILFTSGSTGVPKGVVLSQATLLNNARATLAVTALSQERLFVNVPFHFTSCICHFLSACLSGSTFVGSEDTHLFKDFLQKFVESEATGLGGAPVQLRWLAEASGDHQAYLEGRLRFAFSSGDHLPDAVSETLRTRYPLLRLFTAYGLTELGGRYCVLSPEDTDAHLGSVGRPIPGLSVRVVDTDTGQAVSPGVEGELVASGDLMAQGYLNNEAETREVFRDGSLYTGDLGHLDDDGFVYVTGRANDIFKVNGKKVCAQAIAAELMNSGYFADAAVVSWDVPVFGTVPMACCVLRDGVAFEKGPVLRHLRQALPNSHIPHDFLMLERIPRTGSGKVKRAELRTVAGQRMESQG